MSERVERVYEIDIPGVEAEGEGEVVERVYEIPIIPTVPGAPGGVAAAPTAPGVVEPTPTVKVTTKTAKKDWVDTIPVENLAEVLSYLLYFFKIKYITIGLDPRSEPPVSRGE